MRKAAAADDDGGEDGEEERGAGAGAGDGDDEEGRVLYRACFHGKESSTVSYESSRWLLLSLALTPLWGVGLLMLLYLPLRRLLLRRDLRSRRLYLTPHAIVYKVEKPILFPCFGLYRREKHILLSLVTDVAIEQGCLQSAYGIHSIRIENASHRKPPPGDDFEIIGVDNPKEFRKKVLLALANLRKEQVKSAGEGQPTSTTDDEDIIHENVSVPCFQKSLSQNWAWPQGTGLSSWQMPYSPVDELTPESPSILHGDSIMRNLDDIGNSMKRIGVLIEQSHTLLPREAPL